jgi:phosphatidylserine/phosphatidylglycerophosphate/cardiolipin synthase-like enzyme
MRFRSRKAASGQAFAVSGVNTISFAIRASPAAADGLLGFAVERVDAEKDERYYMPGFKVFPSVVPSPTPHMQVSTYDQPVQSFLWDDFTAEADHEYTYVFHPLKGKPRNLDRSSSPISIKVRTEPLVSQGHDVFFNRGVASSQAYERWFGRTPIANLPAGKQKRAIDWLSRDLGKAMLRFIDGCQAGDRLQCCFYEFRYRPVADALAAAIARGVDVQIIVDAKVNEYTDKKGKFHESFPREDNQSMIVEAGLPARRVKLREHRSTAIAHNKFMVRTPAGGAPTEVWTGSTNVSLGGIAGQTNVGHWARDPAVAALFEQYWTLLHGDPGAVDGDSAAQRRKENADFEKAVEAISPAPDDLRQLPAGTTAVLSPRRGTGVLTSYAQLLDTAAREGCITLAFGVSAELKSFLKDNTSQSAIVFMLLEKKDAPNPRAKTAFVRINASNNVYKAWGSYIRDPVYQWAKETNAGLLGLNQHVSYVHSKFMLIDPLGADPIVVTGSANFSDASVNDNDENMLVIRGDRRVADIYLTEFNRLFNHYYFRSITEATHDSGAAPDSDSLFLCEDAAWQQKYAPGKLKAKRLDLYTTMAGAAIR